MSQKRICNS